MSSSTSWSRILTLYHVVSILSFISFSLNSILLLNPLEPLSNHFQTSLTRKEFLYWYGTWSLLHFWPSLFLFVSFIAYFLSFHLFFFINHQYISSHSHSSTPFQISFIFWCNSLSKTSLSLIFLFILYHFFLFFSSIPICLSCCSSCSTLQTLTVLSSEVHQFITVPLHPLTYPHFYHHPLFLI